MSQVIGKVKGPSAYDIAKENGFVGTEEQWLESLDGADGADGILAEAPKDGKLYARQNGAWSEVEASSGGSYNDAEIRELIAQNANDIESLENNKADKTQIPDVSGFVQSVKINGKSYSVGENGEITLPTVDVTVTLADNSTKVYKIVAVE